MTFTHEEMFPAILRLSRLVFPAALAFHDNNEVQQHRLVKLNAETPLGDYFRGLAVFALSPELVTPRRARIFQEQIMKPVEAYEAIFEDARATLDRNRPQGIDWLVFQAAHKSAAALLDYHARETPLRLMALRVAIAPGRMDPANDANHPPSPGT